MTVYPDLAPYREDYITDATLTWVPVRPAETTRARAGHRVPEIVCRGLRWARRAFLWAASGWATPWLLYLLLLVGLWLINTHQWEVPTNMERVPPPPQTPVMHPPILIGL